MATANTPIYVPWSNLPMRSRPRYYRRLMTLTDRTPRGVADYLFNHNTVSDEYYTPIAVWDRFLCTQPKNTTYFEPFYGDGSGVKNLKDAGYDIVSSPCNFWDIDWANTPNYPILSNPPFSFKWLVIETLLKNRRDFNLILPWQTFVDTAIKHDGADKLRMLKSIYGGDYTVFKLHDNKKFPENTFIMPNGDSKKIGCKILVWRF